MEWLEGLNETSDVVIGSNRQEAVRFSVEQFITLAQKAIKERGAFYVALSGGTTPFEIYKLLATEYRDNVDWSKVVAFWSDERSVPPTDKESNYKMTMEAGIGSLPIPPKNIFRMVGEGDVETNGQAYDELILKHVPDARFDLMMLGMGDDGHTASLFPKTHGLHTKSDRLAIANYVPQKSTWRLSLTFSCINQARHIVIYVLGASKAGMVKQALLGPHNPDEIPIQRVGTPSNKALWVLDQEAAKEITS